MMFLATGTTTFSDIFKSNYIDNITSFNLLDTVLAMFLAFAIGFLINFVYRKTFNGVMYSSSFGASLVAMCVTTTFVILAVTSNVVLSLGMVGALSIVRFRTAVKEPIEICYLFWAIAAGIVIGAGMFPLAVFGSVIIGIILVIFMNKKTSDNPYILVINCENDAAEKNAMSYIKGQVKKTVVKSKTVSKTGIELTLEIRLKDETTDFVNQISSIKQVNNAVLVSYNGDYMS
nr:DUF4956 domain-containing protein [uncultured Lachnoclostridium sp.]